MKDTALIMIDMQRGFISPASPLCIPSAAATIPACARLIDLFHENRLPVFYAVRSYSSDGLDVERTRYAAWRDGGMPLSESCADELSAAMPKEFKLLPSDRTVIKPRFSAFFATNLDLLLRRVGVRTVVLAGTTTPNCIRSTCYDALSLDYDVIVMSDCTSSVTEETQRVNLEDMRRVGARIISMSELQDFMPSL